ncbi:MAG: response regulator [Rhizorhabdus sp.]|uniref:response regulator transcription factor n=1 Tax=Rhizorhabdus sp. TaxID=1968843 RepID=UPI001B74F77E|nr:response regulator [Rhizorhabdus sp.]MBP8231511.1 response regulator [Rhizorhabdus sp.]
MKGKWLYIIDDEAIVRASIISLFQADGGWDHAEFDNSDSFLAALDSLDPGCVLVDMQLPGSNGSVIVEALSRRSPSFPFVVVTGFSDFATAVSMFRLGAVDFLHKPVDPVALFDAVERALHRLRGDGQWQALVSHAQSRVAALTSEEDRSMALIFEGQSNADIASAMGVTPRDVQRARALALAKLDAPTIFDAMRVFALAGRL